MLRSFCERIGSYLHDIFNADAAVSPARAVHRVHIREGRLIGLSDRDKGIVSEVARILTQDLHRSAVLAKRSVRRRLADGKAASSSYALQSGQSKAELAISSTGVIYFTHSIKYRQTLNIIFCHNEINIIASPYQVICHYYYVICHTHKR